MAWSVLQSASGTTSASTVPATFTANVQAGTKIIAIVSVGATTAPAVTSVKDAALNTWTQVGTASQGNARIYIFALDTPAGDVGTKPTLTATSSSTPGLGIEILEVSGLLAGNTTAMVDGTAGTLTGTASSTGSPTYSSTASNEFLLSAYGDFGSGNTVVIAGGWTAGASNVNGSTNSNCLLQYKNSTGGAETDGFTTADTGGWAVAEVAFKLASAGPASGPVFSPAVQAVRARVPQAVRRGGLIYGSTGPRAQDTSFASGRIFWSPGAAVVNPVRGPIFRQAVQAVRARLPVQPLGRNAFRGRTASNKGAPVRNPASGPVFRQRPFPVRARQPLPARGLQFASEIPPPSAAPPVFAGPPFYPARQAVRARLPQQPVLPGRVSSDPGAPVANPSRGPAFRQKPAPVRYVLPPWRPRAGRIGSAPGAPVVNPLRGPPFRPAVQAVRARQPLPRRGRTASSPGVPSAGYLSLRFPAVPGVTSPGITSPGVPFTGTQGPPFRPLNRPARAPVPQPFSKGRVASGPGGPVRNPSPVVTGPPFFPFRRPVQAADPLPRRGRVAGISQGAPPRNPSQGPVSFPVPHPVRAPVPQVFSRGRVSSGPGAPAQNPVHGPAFRQATAPARIRPSLPPRGRTASNPGGPVRNPVPGVAGPPFFPRHDPARIRPSLPPRGRIASGAGVPARNPHQGAAFPAWHGPVQARQPLPPRGRVRSGPGGPVLNPLSAGPAIPQAGQPVRARLPLPPRGRTGSNPGVPAVTAPVFTGPRFTPRHDPARTRPTLPPRGRVSANPGAPVRNPGRGPVFTAKDWPARARIPQNAPRGRASSDPGGPVANIPVATLLFRLGSPYFRWVTGTPGLTSEWSAGTSVSGWAAGVPKTSA